MASFAWAPSVDDIVGADRAAHTGKRTDIARSSVELEDVLDNEDEHTVSSSRMGLRPVDKDNPCSQGIGDDDRGKEVDSELPTV